MELQIEGDRSDVREITGALQDHIGNLLAAPQALTDGQPPQPSEKNITPPENLSDAKRRGRKARGPRGDSTEATALELSHDPEKWGNPPQSWNTLKKAMWLLFVVDEQLQVKEMSASQIVSNVQ